MYFETSYIKLSHKSFEKSNKYFIVKPDLIFEEKDDFSNFINILMAGLLEALDLQFNAEIKTKGFIIEYFGDYSVGISDASWIIEGDFNFKSLENLNKMREKIREAFEYCSDTPISVNTFEELEQQVKKEDNFF